MTKTKEFVLKWKGKYLYGMSKDGQPQFAHNIEEASIFDDETVAKNFVVPNTYRLYQRISANQPQKPFCIFCPLLKNSL